MVSLGGLPVWLFVWFVYERERERGERLLRRALAGCGSLLILNSCSRLKVTHPMLISSHTPQPHAPKPHTTSRPPPPADTITAEKAMQLLKASKRGKLPIVNSSGELLALATRALFREDARLPLGGGWGLQLGGAHSWLAWGWVAWGWVARVPGRWCHGWVMG